MNRGQIHRIVVHRLGSLGDFVVSLPCFHLIRNTFPSAEILLLTNSPVDKRAAPALSVFGDAGFIDGTLEYPVGTRTLAPLAKLRRDIAAARPDLAIYLVQRTAALPVWRDYLFFRAAGVKRLVGFPFRRALREIHPPSAGSDLWELEADRLARCIAPLGDAKPEDPASWDLKLSTTEITAADRLLASVPPPRDGFIALSVGTKMPLKDWGDDNWRHVVAGIGNQNLGLALIGAKEEFDRSQAMARDWPGPVINACGVTTPRESAALLRRTHLLLGHDSGPMHLAAAVGTPCVAVFGTVGKKGEWLPFGAGHHVFYPEPETDSILSIPPGPVLSAARGALAASLWPLHS